jgi:hypothetical protein
MDADGRKVLVSTGVCRKHGTSPDGCGCSIDVRFSRPSLNSCQVLGLVVGASSFG